MKKLKFLALAAIAVVLLTNCKHDGQEKCNTTNSDIQVTLLFEKDGCKVYRFVDGGHSVYYTDCSGKTQYDTGGKANETVSNETIQ